MTRRGFAEDVDCLGEVGKTHLATFAGGARKGVQVRFRDLLRTGLIGVGAAVLVVGLAAAPAAGQNDSPCPPGQPPGRQPGESQPQPQPQRGQYPIGECQLRLSQSIAAQGETIQAAGNGFAPGSSVDLALGGTGIASATTDATGAFATDVQIPVDAAVGDSVITAQGVDAAGDARVLSANFTVTEASGVTPAVSRSADRTGVAGMLPRTGAGIAALAATGAGFIAVGTAAIVAARRRRTAPQPS